MKETINNYVQQCNVCQKCKLFKDKTFGLPQPLEPPSEKWTYITMDFIKPLPWSKNANTGVLVVVDRLPRMIQMVLFPKPSSATEVAQLFPDHIYKHYVLSSVIIATKIQVLFASSGSHYFIPYKQI